MINALERIAGASLLVMAVAYGTVLLGGRLLNLHVDEAYFLHAAYALAQGWGEGFDASRPYAVYEHWLSLSLATDRPGSLWSAVAIDSALQLLALVLLAWLGVRYQHRKSVLGFALVVCGVLYAFSVGRLAEHRPDYLAVTLLFAGMLCAVTAGLSDSGRSPSVHAFWAGALLGLAAGFSPRALLMIGMSLPLFALATRSAWRAGAMLHLFWPATLGALGAAVMLWMLTDFSLFHSVSELIGDFLERDGIGCCQSLGDRVLRRKALVAVNALTLLVCVSVVLAGTAARSRWFAGAGLALSSAQLALIVLDAQIFEYGYSYGLAGFLMMVLALGALDRDRDSRGAVLTAVAGALFAVLHLLQLPMVVRSKGYNYQRHAVLTQPDFAALTTRETIDLSLRRGSLIPTH